MSKDNDIEDILDDDFEDGWFDIDPDDPEFDISRHDLLKPKGGEADSEKYIPEAIADAFKAGGNDGVDEFLENGLSEMDELDDEGWEEFDPNDPDFDPEFQIPPKRPAKPVKPLPLPILYEDDDILVVNKPAGMESKRGQSAVDQGVLDRLEDELENFPEGIKPIHRLARDASGVMVLAKTKKLHSELAEKWQSDSVEKIYWVIVHGVLPSDDGSIDLPLRATNSQKRPVLTDPKDGKESLTTYKVLEQYRQYTLLEVNPITGRLYQIRVHFASQGTPVLLDKLYGSPDPLCLSDFKKRYRRSARKREEKPLLDRLAMHSHKIEFTHPTTNERMSFSVEPPKDFATAMKQLAKYGR